MTTSERILVIGAGAVGATIAQRLARAGHDVLIVDAGAGPGAGCSYANAGLLSPDHVEAMANPRNVRLGLRHLLDAAGPFRLHPRPALVPWLASFVWASRPKKSAALTQLLRTMAHDSLALHLQLVDEGLDTSCRRTGSVDRLPDGREVINPDDATCNTLDYVTALLADAKAAGAEIRWNATVQGIHVVDGSIASVEVDGEQLTPATVVLAAGMDAKPLAAQAGVRIPLQGAAGYVIDLERGRDDPERPVRLTQAKVVVTPFRDRVRVCGTLDLGGRAGIQGARVDAIRDAARTELPGLAWDREVEVWRGDRPTTSDGAPVIGRPASVDNLVIAAGHGMWGLVLAPITAALVGRDLTDGTRAYDPRLSPDRFSLTLTRRRRKQ
ncbi:NAD(P)/FAD-dependent oxidoreductase [Mariniluteicoccus flavus]